MNFASCRLQNQPTRLASGGRRLRWRRRIVMRGWWWRWIVARLRGHLAVIVARRQVVSGQHALLISNVVTALRTLTPRSTLASANGGSHRQTGCGTSGRGVMAARAHHGPNRCAHNGTNHRRANRSFVAGTGTLTDGLLGIAPAVLVFGSEQLQGLSSGGHDGHTGAGWRGRTTCKSQQTSKCQREPEPFHGRTPEEPTGTAGTVCQPLGHDATYG